MEENMKKILFTLLAVLLSANIVMAQEGPEGKGKGKGKGRKMPPECKKCLEDNGMVKGDKASRKAALEKCQAECPKPEAAPAE